MRLISRLTGDESTSVASEESAAQRRGAWYADPYGEGELRWWDGKRWTTQVKGSAVTEELAPEPEIAEPAAAQPEPPTPPKPPEPKPPEPEPVRVVMTGSGEYVRRLPGSTSTRAREARPQPQPAPPPEPQPRAIPTRPTIKRIGTPERQDLPALTCPSCSRLTHTEGDFCPYCGRSFVSPPEPSLSARVRLPVIVVLGLVLLAVLVGVVINVNQDNQSAARHRRAVAAARARAAAEKQRLAEVTHRRGLESTLQNAITRDASEKASQGVLTDGPPLSTACANVSGGSSINLGARVGTYDCLAVYRTGTSVTRSGYSYIGTINFATGSLNWRLGTS